MPLLDTAASAVVLVAGLYLVALGLLCGTRPHVAGRFLSRFATTPRPHWIEIAIRTIIGAALVHRAPLMRLSAAFSAAGWILVITSALLALVPWRMHARLAALAVPQALRVLPLLAAGSVLGGAFVIWAWGAGWPS